jgi:hypothetical protein
MRKRFTGSLAHLLSILLLFTLPSCAAKAGVGAESREEVYAELDRILKEPSQADASFLRAPFTFVAMAYSPPISGKSAQEPSLYCFCVISRNSENYFVLSLDNLAQAPKELTRIRITGKLAGTAAIQAESEGQPAAKAEEYALVLASEIEELPLDPTLPVDTSKLIKFQSADGSAVGSLLLIGAHYSPDRAQIILYYAYRNESGDGAVPPTDRLAYSHGGARLKAHEGDYAGPVHLDAAKDGMTSLGPGAYAAYWIALDSAEGAVNDSMLNIKLYDDSFDMTNQASIPIAASFDEFSK